jgi:hypothetical protein
MSAPELVAILERIARLWSELQATPVGDPKHEKLMGEIHDESATYLRLFDLQEARDRSPRAPRAPRVPKPPAAPRHEE